MRGQSTRVFQAGVRARFFDLHKVVRQVDWDANIAMIADAESERQMKKL